MPTQMPRKGRARMVTASSIASNSPPNAPKARRQDGKAPSPGSTIRSARATSSDRKERAGADGDCLFDRLEQPAKCTQGTAAGRKGPVTGQHDPVGAGHVFGAGRHQHLACTGFLRHALKGLFSRVQVAGIVIYKDGQHLVTLGAAEAVGA